MYISSTLLTTEHIQLKLLRTGISVLLSCHVCEIVISTVVKSVYVSIVHVSYGIRSISIRNNVKYRNRIDKTNWNTNSQVVDKVLNYYALSIIEVVIAITIINIICYSNQSPPVSHTTGCSPWNLYFQWNTFEL